MLSPTTAATIWRVSRAKFPLPVVESGAVRIESAIHNMPMPARISSPTQAKTPGYDTSFQRATTLPSNINQMATLIQQPGAPRLLGHIKEGRLWQSFEEMQDQPQGSTGFLASPRNHSAAMATGSGQSSEERCFKAPLWSGRTPAGLGRVREPKSDRRPEEQRGTS